MRTDSHNNPAAFTTDIAEQAGLVYGVDYTAGDAFPGNPALHTARLAGDPVQLTIRVIDAIGFYTKTGGQRWVYIGIPKFVWDALEPPEKRDVIGFMYGHEGGVTMRPLFPNYGRR
jgi:hypothetical protein